MDAKQSPPVVVPIPKKRDTLADLLAQCDPRVAINPEEREWLDAPAVGLEGDAVNH